MKRDTFALFVKIGCAFVLVWLWFGLLLPKCISVANTISMTVAVSFVMFVGVSLAIWVVRNFLSRKGEK